MKKNVIIIGPYLPGKYFGGPVKSLLNLVETLSDNFNFYVITGDRDLNATEVYSNVNIGSWNKVGKAKVFYIPKGKEYKYIKFILKDLNYDLVFTNSFFSKNSIIIQFLKCFNFINSNVIVAPRGEFSNNALGIKSFKKKLYLHFYKFLCIQNKLTFTCTSLSDKKDIQKVLGKSSKIRIAGNIVIDDLKLSNTFRKKESGYLKIVTISRISRIKNIDYSLSVLKLIGQTEKKYEVIIFDIYGPLEDEEYWRECLAIQKNLDKKIIVNYKGAVEYGEVIKVLSNYHIFLFPTKGENFGHVIQEALLSGCPVIISDQTPWRELDKQGVGFDISLKNIKKFIDAIKYYLYMEGNEYNDFSNKAYNYGINKVEKQHSIKEHIDMFNSEIKY